MHGHIIPERHGQCCILADEGEAFGPYLVRSCMFHLGLAVAILDRQKRHAATLGVCFKPCP
eukprot:1085198-Alexandrium_andersonii.AAC.1